MSISGRIRTTLSCLLLFSTILLTSCAYSAGGSSQGGLAASPSPEFTPIHTPVGEEVSSTNALATKNEVLITPTLSPDEAPSASAVKEFTTDFSKHLVPYDEILSGGPPKDGIPAIDEPQFISVSQADQWLAPQEPVLFVRVGEDARAYPIQIVIWHEIVNDTVGGVPLVITFCPLCNTAIAFKRTINETVFDFGTTGRLRFSNLIMYDRQTETWWQQASGRAIVGSLIGMQLEYYPAAIISWEDFKNEHTNGQVLSRDTGYKRSYGRNPYAGYDDVSRPPFAYNGPETPGILPPVARVLAVEMGEESVAYSFQVLERQHVVNDLLGDTPIAVFWEPGTASPLDAGVVSAGREVGSANAYDRRVANMTLTFIHKENGIFDQQTGSQWSLLGTAISGEFSGQQLQPIISVNHFWFSWAAFRPETRVYMP